MFYRISDQIKKKKSQHVESQKKEYSTNDLHLIWGLAFISSLTKDSLKVYILCIVLRTYHTHARSQYKEETKAHIFNIQINKCIIILISGSQKSLESYLTLGS